LLDAECLRFSEVYNEKADDPLSRGGSPALAGDGFGAAFLEGR
jgi:hypothetical protein